MSWLSRIKEAWNPPKEEFDDPVFGRLNREWKGMWQGEVVFHHSPSRTESFSILIDSGEGRPTVEQSEWFRAIQERFDSLWPKIVDALARYHPDISTREAVERHIEFTGIGLSPICEGHEPEWTFDCSFDCDPFMGYSAEFIGWELVGIGGGD